MNKVIISILSVLLLLAVSSSVYFWFAGQRAPAISKKEYVPAPQIKTVEKIKRVEVPGPERIVTIEKQVIVEKLKLPDWVKSDENKQVTATAEIQPYEGKTNAVSVLDTKTGISEIIAKQVPLPFVALINDKELYAKIGYSTSRETKVSVGGRYLFGRLGKIKVGFYGEGQAAADGNRSAGEAVAGVVITY